MLKSFYSNIFIPLASVAVKILQIVNPKIRAREQTCYKLIEDLENEKNIQVQPAEVPDIIGEKWKNISGKDNRKVRYWFHVASMGEFEQAKPIIERLKQLNPNTYVFVTFYSPSGYENQKKYVFADEIAYMPIDSAKNAARLINVIRPDKAIFVRYEIWLNHLLELHKRNIPIYLVNASRPRTKLLNSYYKTAYRLFEKIFVMMESEMEYFAKICGANRVAYMPDTRFDRIAERVNANRDKPLFDSRLFGGNCVLVAGSSWRPDEDILLDAVERINKSGGRKISLVLVPHEPTQENLRRLAGKCRSYVLLSELEKNQEKYFDNVANRGKIVVVDSIGKLLRIYANADIAYVGGAFGVGIHSVTEPAGYGLPIICGKDFSNSPDAVEMEKNGALVSVSNANELRLQLEKLTDYSDAYIQMSQKAGNYVSSRLGATDKFIKAITNDLDL